MTILTRVPAPRSASGPCSLALGFLFMGAGSLTFGTSPQAAAALAISLFPRWPASTADQRCHLQARRWTEGGQRAWV